jgi:hypothetical protein
MIWIISALLAVIGIFLFVLPHHRGDQSAASLLDDLREFLSESVDSPGGLLMLAITVVGCLGVLLPAVLAALIAFVPYSATRATLVLGGLALVIVAVFTLFAETLSNSLFGFGGGSMYKITTAVAYLAPMFPFVCGIAAVVLGAMRVRIS